MIAQRNATVMLPASDVARARAFYEDKLGFTPVSVEVYGTRYRLANGGEVFLYKSDYAGSAGHTLMSFASPDLEADMAELRGRGVSFIDYDLPGLKTEGGIATFGPVKNAWARDTEGNILGFVEGMG